MKIFIRAVTNVLVFAGLLSLTGCSTFGSRYQQIYVISDPSEAQVYVSGQLQGTTPVSVKVRRNQSLVFELRKEGYKTKFEYEESRMPSGIGMVDMIFGSALLLPLLGLLSDAAWAYQSDTIAVSLEEKTVPPEAQ